MNKRIPEPPPKPMAIETRVVFSMLYQVKDRIEIKKWMKPQDVYEAHPMLFKKMASAASRDYRLEASLNHYLKAIEILMEGMNQDEFL